MNGMGEGEMKSFMGRSMLEGFVQTQTGSHFFLSNIKLSFKGRVDAVMYYPLYSQFTCGSPEIIEHAVL